MIPRMGLASCRILLAAAAGLILLSGCTRYDVRVTSYRAAGMEMPEPGGPGRIAVVAETRPPEPLLDREIVRKIEYLLHERGHETGEVDGAEYVLAAFAAVDSGRRVVDWYDDYVPGSYETSMVYTRWGRRAYVRTYYPGYYVTRPYSYTNYNRFLSLTLYNAARFPEGEDRSPEEAAKAIVWRSTAGSAGQSDDLRRVADALLVASFEHFGADTGRQVREVVSDRDERVEALRAAVAGRGHEAAERRATKRGIEGLRDRGPASPSRDRQGEGTERPRRGKKPRSGRRYEGEAATKGKRRRSASCRSALPNSPLPRREGRVLRSHHSAPRPGGRGSD